MSGTVNVNVSAWLNENLSALLYFDVPQDLIEYIMVIENDRDLEDYLKTLLDFNNREHVQFFENYKLIRHFKQPVKGDEKTNGEIQSKDYSKNKSIAGSEVVMLKGRHPCNCEATKHPLKNNCLSCGRIVCAQEGSGPCLFCGSLVCSKEEQEFINAKTAQSKKLLDNLMEAGRPKGWDAALAHRDKLLSYDQSSLQRSKVIDDEGEYFSVGSVWLSKEERDNLISKEEGMREKRHSSRRQLKLSLDFAGRTVKEDVAGEEPNVEEDAIDYSPKKMIIPDDITLDLHPQYVSTGLKSSMTDQLKNSHNHSLTQSGPRVQDRELLEMTDWGLCLSMHQPWASLLVHGIKRHEGRSWYSAHRGRLWVAAASKPPSDSEIAETEEFYQVLRAGEGIQFPGSYPTSCLLGCVNIMDVLSQDQYKGVYEKQESDSPFVYICDNAIPLSIKIPMSGKHKIYKLDRKIHEAAKKALSRQLRS